MKATDFGHRPRGVVREGRVGLKTDVPIAENDPLGTWTCEVSDLVTGVRQSLKVEYEAEAE